MKDAFDRFRHDRLEPAILEQQQLREIRKAAKHLDDFASIRDGYLRTRVEQRSEEYDELMEESQAVLQRFDGVDADGLVRAAAACVVHEDKGGADRELWRPVWSERFDDTGRALEPEDVEPTQASMLWTVAHLRSFGDLPNNDRLTATIRRPLDTVPFYIFVNAPIGDLLDIAAGCVDAYRGLIEDAANWVPAPS